MREINQRFWDAMIIKSWNEFGNSYSLGMACKYEFGVYPDELGLLRCKNLIKQGTRVWVARQLTPLSERLWITPKEKQVALLDWLEETKLDCIVNKKAEKYGGEAAGRLYRNRLHMKQARLSNDIEQSSNRNNMWKVVK
jgi:hypothetical protein